MSSELQVRRLKSPATLGSRPRACARARLERAQLMEQLDYSPAQPPISKNRSFRARDANAPVSTMSR